MAALALVVSLPLLMIFRQPPDLAFTWQGKGKGGHFLFPRNTGGVVAVGFGGKATWLDSDGQSLAQVSISPDSFRGPVSNQDQLISGTSQGYVYAFDLEIGALLWKSRPHMSSCQVALDGKGNVYAIAPVAQALSEVAVLDLKGNEVKRYRVQGSIRGRLPIALPDGTLIGDDTIRTAGSRNARLAAYDSKGKGLWKKELTGFAVWHLMPGFREDVLCVAHKNRVFSVDTKTGKTNWDFVNPHKPKNGFYSIYKTSREEILIANSRHLFLLDAGGKLKWQRRFPGAVGTVVVMPDGSSYMVVYTSFAVMTNLRTRWIKYQVGQGNQSPKFLLPTGDKAWLYRISPDGNFRRVGKLEGGLMLECSGPESELYGTMGSVARIDP